MSQEHVWPATWREGHEVPARDGRPRAAAANDGAGAALVLAGLPQAFDAWVFGALALGVFPQLFFSALAPAAGVAAAVGVWALAYVAALAWRAVLARRGHRTRGHLAAARLVFAIATVATAAAPAAASVVWAPLVLVVLRLAQGLALGALASPRPAAGDARCVLLRSRVVAGVIGLAAAGGILGGLALALPSEDFVTWGWRYPFVIALTLNMGALFGDLRAAELHRRARGRPELRLVAVSGGLVR
ncbi:MAG TPA: hypothetical protein VJS38_09960 [Phenylobacterium sp.]|uniref:hypothetical protein n=1 Tax=Phenylobacterium sp. TaxID=1871053 RepID=UPI002B48C6D5|nr:hypothetical protein [Phenylobacterium sp.]HKR88487.1 hypothetical protein [Phenylobacterium sp.]